MGDAGDVGYFVGLDAACDVANVGFEGDVFIRLMSTFADARVGRCENLVPHLAQCGRGLTVAPATVPSPVNENERLFFCIQFYDSCGWSNTELRGLSLGPHRELPARYPFTLSSR